MLAQVADMRPGEVVAAYRESVDDHADEAVCAGLMVGVLNRRGIKARGPRSLHRSENGRSAAALDTS
jgi:hypothetical protein